MKKTIGLFILFLLTISVFGQRFLNRRSAIEYDKWSDKTNLVHFTTESGEYKHFYILAYEPNFPNGMYDNTTRNVYLYSYKIEPMQNGKYPEHVRWIRVCNEPVFEHYYKDAFNYTEADFYLFNEHTQNLSHSSVRKIGNDVEFTIDIIEMINGKVTIHQEKILLQCIGDGGSDGYLYKVVQ